MSVSHVQKKFVRGSSPWRTFSPFIPCIHDSRNSGDVQVTIVIVFKAELYFTNEEILLALDAEVGGSLHQNKVN